MAKEQEQRGFWQSYVKPIINGGVFTFKAALAPSLDIALQNIKVAKQNYPEKNLYAIVKMLYEEGGVRRFYNGFIPYTTRSAMVFGGSGVVVSKVSEPIDSLGYNTFVTSVLKIATAASCETTSTVGLEACELIRTKMLPVPPMHMIQSVTYRVKLAWNIAPFAFVRNGTTWSAMIGTNAYCNHYDLPQEQRTAVATIAGILAGIISTPVDRALTKSFGTGDSPLSVLSNAVKMANTRSMFAGLAPRCGQMALYAIASDFIIEAFKSPDMPVVGYFTKRLKEQGETEPLKVRER